MLSLSLPGRVFLCTLPTDMRKSFDGLAALVRQALAPIRCPATGSFFATAAAIGSRSWPGKRTVGVSGTSAWRKAPFASPLLRATAHRA